MSSHRKNYVFLCALCVLKPFLFLNIGHISSHRKNYVFLYALCVLKPLFKKNSVVKDFPYICLNLKSKYTYDHL